MFCLTCISKNWIQVLMYDAVFHNWGNTFYILLYSVTCSRAIQRFHFWINHMFLTSCTYKQICLKSKRNTWKVYTILLSASFIKIQMIKSSSFTAHNKKTNFENSYKETHHNVQMYIRTIINPKTPTNHR